MKCRINKERGIMMRIVIVIEIEIAIVDYKGKALMELYREEIR